MFKEPLKGPNSELHTNCGNYSEEVYCEDTYGGPGYYGIAVGLVMHHKDDAFTGIQLVCRDAEVDEFPALKSDAQGY